MLLWRMIKQQGGKVGRPEKEGKSWNIIKAGRKGRGKRKKLERIKKNKRSIESKAVDEGKRWKVLKMQEGKQRKSERKRLKLLLRAERK